MYRALLDHFNDGAKRASESLPDDTVRPMFCLSLVDDDFLVDRIVAASRAATGAELSTVAADIWPWEYIDALCVQSYAGRYFGSTHFDTISDAHIDSHHLLDSWTARVPVSLIISDYGIDVVHDDCGSDGNFTVCLNALPADRNGNGDSVTPVTRSLQPIGTLDTAASTDRTYVDESAQAEWLYDMTEQMVAFSRVQVMHFNITLNSSSASALGSAGGVIRRSRVLGGFVNSYVDEKWRVTGRTGEATSRCHGSIPFGKVGFDRRQCQWRAHANCPAAPVRAPQPFPGVDYSALNSLCGWYAGSSQPDGYTNAAFFGIMSTSTQPVISGHRLSVDVVTPRLALHHLANVWRNARSIPQLPQQLWVLLSVAAVIIAGSTLLIANKRLEAEKSNVSAYTRLSEQVSDDDDDVESMIDDHTPSAASSPAIPPDPPSSSRFYQDEEIDEI